MHHLASSSRNKGGENNSPIDSEIQAALARLSIDTNPQSEDNVQGICTLMKKQLGVSIPLPEETLRSLAIDMINASLNGDNNKVGQSTTNPTLSSSSESSDVEFSTREQQPKGMRTAWSSDSQSSSQRGGGAGAGAFRGNENYEPEKYPNYTNGTATTTLSSFAQSSSIHSAALLNQQRNGTTIRSARAVQDAQNNTVKRDVNGSGTGTMSCTPIRSSHKRTPTKQKERQPPKGKQPFISVNTTRQQHQQYVSQNETNEYSPTAQLQQQQQRSGIFPLNRLFCGPSQRAQQLDESVNATTAPSLTVRTASAPSKNDTSTNLSFQFNPSFPIPSPVAVPQSTTPVARRTQTTTSPRPGLQEKEEQAEASLSPSAANNRTDKKPSPRPVYAKQHSRDDDGTQQPLAPQRVFPPTVTSTPMVQTVPSQEDTSNKEDHDTSILDGKTPTSLGSTTPMDFSPTSAAKTPAPTLAGFTTLASGQTPFADTPMQKPNLGATPFFASQPVPTPGPPVVDGPPSLPTLPVVQNNNNNNSAPPAQQQQQPVMLNLGGQTRSRRLKHPKVNLVLQTRRKGPTAALPKVGGEETMNTGGEQEQPAQVPRVPSPMEGVQQNHNHDQTTEAAAGFQMGKPKPKITLRNKTNRFNLPSTFSSSVSTVQEPTKEEQIQSPTPEPEPELDYSGILQLVASKREEARSAYLKCDYILSIHCHTKAIQSLLSFKDSPSFDGDVMAILLANRAAGLVMLGALDAAVQDCRKALLYVSDGGPNGERFSRDAGPPMKLKIQNRLARSLLRKGSDEEARIEFESAIETARDAITQLNRVRPNDVDLRSMLEYMEGEATLGLDDTRKVQSILDNVRTLLRNCDTQRQWTYAEPLRHINLALQHADASVDLVGTKLSLLTRMQRWREAAGVLERMAALNVKFDGVFIGDLAAINPFPGVPEADQLKADFFGELRAENHQTAEQKLSSKAASEAVLRMPYNLTKIYLRALRLQERYPAAEAAIRALESLVHHGTSQKSPEELRDEFKWLPNERSQLERTKKTRQLADDYYNRGELAKAADEYSKCLVIDGEGRSRVGDVPNAGGRLHAVLHCNRTACLIALTKFEEALEDASAAIRIHPHYMKAILRRGRCYWRLMRFPEAISEFNRWLSLVEEAKKPNWSPPERSPCLFDGPKNATEKDIQTVRGELEKAHLAQRRADAAVREDKSRREQQRQRWNDVFSSAHTAQQRREEWYNSQSDPRRWDSFRNKGPRPDYRRSASTGPSQPRERAGPQARAHSEERTSPGGRNSDHYAVLDINVHATEEQITKAYRKLAKKYHPDKNPGEDTTAKFHAIKEAHDVLTDRVKRQAYDAERRRFGRRH